MQNVLNLGLSPFALASAMSLASLNAGCLLHTDGLQTGGTGGMSSSSSSDGGSGGVGASGGTGGGVFPGEQYVPQSFLPGDAVVLPPTRAYLAWSQPAAIPAGRVFSSYEFCHTTGAASEIDGDQCPGAAKPVAAHVVVDPLKEDTSLLWKVRTIYDNGGVSDWSAIRNFMTDHSLSAWWRWNGDAKDSGPDALDGTLQGGASFVDGIDQKALHCDGAKDFADMGSGPNLTSALTLSAWIFGNGLPATPDTGVVVKEGLAYALTYHTDGKVYFYINDGGNNVSASVPPNEWHHVAGVFDGTTVAASLKLYVDGVLAGSKSSNSATFGSAGKLLVGAYANSRFKGLIDNVTLYDADLDVPALINELCATQAAGEAPLSAACQP